MKEIEMAVSLYERLRKKQYQITIPALDAVFCLKLVPAHFHHLLGFQHLTDLPDIAFCPRGADRFYRLLRNGAYSEEAFQKSVHFPFIEERVASFFRLERLLSASDAKIIINFDRRKASSDIEAKFILFERTGNPFAGEAVTYYNLFIGYNDDQGCYYPATFVVEHSRKYQSEQRYYDCMIEELTLEAGKKRRRKKPAAEPSAEAGETPRSAASADA